MSDNPEETLGTQPEEAPVEAPVIEAVPEIEQEVVTRAALDRMYSNIESMIDKKLDGLKTSMKQSMTDRDKLIREEIAVKTKEYEAIAAAAGLSEAARAAGIDRIKSEVAERHMEPGGHSEQERQTASPPDPQEVERVFGSIRSYEAEAKVFLTPLDKEFETVARLGNNPTPEEYERAYIQAVQAKAKRMGVTVTPRPVASTAARSASVLTGQVAGGSRLDQLTKRLTEIQSMGLSRPRALNEEASKIVAEMEALERNR